MSFSTMIDAGTCQTCQQVAHVSVEFPFCPQCGWDFFESIIDDNQNSLLLDYPIREAFRKRWLKHLDEMAAEESRLQAALNTQTKVHKTIQQQISDLRSKILMREKELSNLKESCAEMRENFTLFAGVLLNPNDRDTIQKAKMEIHYHFQTKLEIVHHNEEKHVFLFLQINQALPENYDLALGISREPMRKIGDAHLVVRIKLKPKDFQRNISDDSWQAVKKLPVQVLSKGKWHIKIAPMEQIIKNKIGGRWVRVTTPDFSNNKVGSPVPHTIIV